MEVSRITYGVLCDPGATPAQCETGKAILEEFDTLTDEVQQIKHVYACFGLAAYLCQCVETGISMIVLAHARLTGEAPCLAAFEAIEERLARKTLGQILLELRRVADFEGKSDETIVRALQIRNSLMHGFFEKHALNLVSASGRRRIVQEISTYIGILGEANTYADIFGHCAAKFLGMTEEQLSQAYDKLKAEALSE